MRFQKLWALLLAVILLTSCARETGTDRIRQKDACFSDAILYALEGTELEYNVTCYGDAGKAEITDESGSGIDSLEALSRVLGKADAPAVKQSTDPGERTIGKAVTADLQTDKRGNITQITVKRVRPRPVIGITWKMDTIGADYQSFAEALERNGALVVYLPLVISQDHAAMVLSQIDGLFVTGGEDWNPRLYGQEPQPHGAVDCNDIRDASDLYLIKGAIEMDLPMLTVCRGTQGLNIALGGKLLQDVPTYLGGKVLDGSISESRVSKNISEEGCGCEGEKHLRVQLDGLNHEKSAGYHELQTIDPDSKWLYEIFGTEALDFVATAHHQALDPEHLGQGLTVAAESSDGIIEAVEYRENTFVLGLQWHPEKDALTDSQGVDVSQEASNRPLRALVEYAGENSTRKGS